MELQEAIQNRRSIRKFTDYAVSGEQIELMLEAARWAPSWSNTQVGEFVVVRDKELIRRITETYSPHNPARECSFEASVIIVACAKMKVSGFKNGQLRTKFAEWFMFDLGMAVQNLCLKAHELGLGTVVVGSMNHDEAKAILNMPEDYEAVCAIPVGQPDESPVKPRRPLNETVHLNYFGQRI